MLTLHKRYIRTSPKGDQTVVVIYTEEELAYHNDLAKSEFVYKEVVPTVVPGGTCVSCEG